MTDRRAADRWEWALVVGWIVAFAVARGGSITEADPYWQIRAGLENLAGTPLVRADTWSWAPVDALFYPNSPAWNAVLATTWQWGEFWGVFALTSVAVFASLAVIAIVARAIGARPLPILLVLIAVAFVSFAEFSPRATLAAQTLLLATMGLGAWWSARAHRFPALVNAGVVGVGALAISVAGNWIHLSWLAWSLVAAAGWSVLWLLTATLSRGRQVTMAFVGTVGFLGGALLSPYGLTGWERSAAVYEASHGLIAEWSGAWLHPALAVAGIVTVVLAIQALVGTSRRFRTSGALTAPDRLATVLALIAVPIAVAGFWNSRFIGVAVTVVAPVAAIAVTATVTRVQAAAATEPPRGIWRSARVREWTTGHFWRVVLTLVLIVLTPFVLWTARPHAQPRIVALAPLVPPSCQVFGAQEYTDPLILLRPDVTVWIDGRVDYYGRERGLAFQHYYFASDPSEPVPPGTECVIVPDVSLDDRGRHLTTLLEASPDWELAQSRSGLNLWVPRPETADTPS